MTDFVKDFIEYNIETVEQHDWEELIELWHDACERDYFYTDSYFQEFTDVLMSIGIDFATESLSKRTEYVKNLFSQYLDEEIDVARLCGNVKIDKSQVILRLDSHFGFTMPELENLLDAVAQKDYNLNVGLNYYLKE